MSLASRAVQGVSGTLGKSTPVHRRVLAHADRHEKAAARAALIAHLLGLVTGAATIVSLTSILAALLRNLN